MEILVAGSTGLIGTALIQSLKQNGNEVTPLLRREPDKNSKDSKDSGDGKYLLWNPPTRGVDLEGAKFDAVINLCGENIAAQKWSSEQKRLIYQSRISSTRLLVGAFLKMKHPPKVFLNASGIGIYGNRGDMLLTEAASSHYVLGEKINLRGALGNIGEPIPKVTTGDFLADLCLDWEQTAQLATGLGVQSFALRLGLVLDKNAVFYKRQKLLFKMGLGGWLGNPRSWMSWISLDDVVGAIEFLLKNSDKVLQQSRNQETDVSKPDESNINPKIFKAVNLTAPTPVTAKEFAKALAKALKRPAVFRIPKLLPRIQLGKELVTALTHSLKAIPKELLDAGYEFRHPEISSAFQDVLRKR